MKVLILIFCIIPFAGIPQQATTVKVEGEVLDAKNKSPIPFAYARLQNTSIGLYANSEGKFSLIIDHSHEQSSLIFSCMGYRNKKLSIKEVLQNPVVLLEDTIIMLEEVLITNIKPEEVIQSASKRMVENYPQGPFELKGFYRTSYSENNVFVRLFEASIVVADKGFTKPNGYQAMVYQNRKSNDYRQFKWHQDGNALFNYFKKDNIRNKRFFFDKKQMNDYHYELDGITEFNGAEVYVIKVSLKDSIDVSYYADVYIRSIDFAVVEVKDITVIKKTKRYSVADNVHISFTGGSTQTKYVEHNGKFYLSYSSALAKHEVFDNKGAFRGTLDMDEELIIYETSDGESEVTKNVKRQGDVYLADYPYDENFWRTFHVPVDTKLSRKIKADLNSRENLANQFKANSKPNE